MFRNCGDCSAYGKKIIALIGLWQYRDELECDFAEFYHVLNFEALPLRKVATLSFGLPQNSRTMRKAAGAKLTTEETLLAAAVDRLSILTWQNTEDARHGRNRPKSILSELNKKDEEKAVTFSTAEEFEAARNAILQRGE